MTRNNSTDTMSLGIIFLWIFVGYFLFFRKTGAYVSVGPLYAVELFMIIFAVFFSRFSLKKKDVLVFSTLIIYLLLNLVVVLRSGLPADIQDLCIGFYPFLIFLGYLFAARINPANGLIDNVILWLFALTPLVHYLISPLFLLSGQILELPGNTFVYPLSVFFSLLLLSRSQKIPVKIIASALIFSNLLQLLLLDQRAAIIGLLAILAVYFIFDFRKAFSFQDVLTIIIAGCVAIVIAVGLAEQIGSLLSTTRYGGIDKIGQYLLSVFGLSDIGVGTRTHRLDMWASAMEQVVSSPLYLFFGVGYSSEITDASFRNVHNGFISVLFRSGLLGLVFFCWLLWLLMYRFRFGGFGLAFYMLIAALLDAFTGTIFDSPFLSSVVYFISGIYLYQSKSKFVNTAKIQVANAIRTPI